jgi:oxidase EvaA
MSNPVDLHVPPLFKTHQVKDWLRNRADEIPVRIEKVRFSELEKWLIEPGTGNLIHETGKFFSIVGIDVRTNYGTVSHWTQPIIKQPEVGILGVITKRFEGKVYFLMQAKIEPGNLNHIQLSPTVQATKSNYTQVHHGKIPPYLEYFRDRGNRVMVDQLQSEQGARFVKKRNRNIIIDVKGDVPRNDNFMWMTLEQIVRMLWTDNTVNMDTRSVISGLLFFGQEDEKEETRPLNTFGEINRWLTHMKTTFELDMIEIPLEKVEKWITTDSKIYHEEQKYFEVLPMSVSIEGREVNRWTQPMIRAKQEGICAFIIKRINGVYHFLVQGKVECGNFDIVEMAPTVQCLTGNYKDAEPSKLPYLDYILNVSDDQIVYDVMQSEEGGRFYQEQNRNMIVEAGDSFATETPDNYIWMSLRQIQRFMLFNNFLNVQARSLISALVTRENEFS